MYSPSHLGHNELEGEILCLSYEKITVFVQYQKILSVLGIINLWRKQVTREKKPQMIMRGPCTPIPAGQVHSRDLVKWETAETPVCLFSEQKEDCDHLPEWLSVRQ